MTIPSATIDITTSAPGSTMLLGEHAVLHGYPAIVVALNQRLQVRLQARVATKAEVVMQSSLGNWQGSWQALASLNVAQQPLRFVMASLQHVLQLESSAKHLDAERWQVTITIDSAIDATLGLGSSAAVTVALVAALQQWLQGEFLQPSVLENAVAIIRHVQGRGSGADAAASCYGGWVLYQSDTLLVKSLAVKPLLLQSEQMPAQFRLVSTGYKTPTPQVLELVAQWQQQAPTKYAAIYAAMGRCVNQGEQAINTCDWQALAKTMQAYQQQMVALGVCDEGTQETIAAITASVQKQPAQPPWACKISGSGLGDCVLCFGVNELSPWPHEQILLGVEAQGLQLDL